MPNNTIGYLDVDGWNEIQEAYMIFLRSHNKYMEEAGVQES